MSAKKQYTFSKTLSKVADVVAKVRSMEKLTEKEELIYNIQVKGMTKEMADNVMKNKLKARNEI